MDDRDDFMTARTRPVRLPDGTELVLRRVVPDDKALFLAAWERLSPQSRYRRFFSPMPHLGTDLLAYLTEVDHQRHSAWLAVVEEETGPAVVGVSRAIRLEDPRTAEVAITVIDPYQRRGIGHLLLGTLVLEAVEQGVTRFVGLVLADNPPMHAVLRRAGARLHHEDAGTLRFDLDVRAVAAALEEGGLVGFKAPAGQERVGASDPRAGGDVRPLIDWLFRNRRTGRITIAQFPNVALGVFLVASVLRRLLDPAGSADAALKVLATGGLVWWAADELLRGVNPWRRFLGGSVLAAQLLDLVSR